MGCQLLSDDEEDVAAKFTFSKNTIVDGGGGKQFCTKGDFR